MASKTSTPAPAPRAPAPGNLSGALGKLGSMAAKSRILGALGLNSPAGLLSNAAYAAAEQAVEDQQKFNEMNPELEGKFYPYGMKRGGKVKPSKMHKAPKERRYAGGGSIRSSASKRADGIAKKGKTRGKMV